MQAEEWPPRLGCRPHRGGHALLTIPLLGHRFCAIASAQKRFSVLAQAIALERFVLLVSAASPDCLLPQFFGDSKPRTPLEPPGQPRLQMRVGRVRPKSLSLAGPRFSHRFQDRSWPEATLAATEASHLTSDSLHRVVTACPLGQTT